MASMEYTNAMFNSVRADLFRLLAMLPDIPFVDEQEVARSHLSSEKGTKMLLKLVEDAIAAGEKADAQEKKDGTP